MPLFGEMQDRFAAPGLVAAGPPSFDLGPTAREASVWTRGRRRLTGLGSSAEPVFLGGSFDSSLVVQQAGSLTQLRRSIDAAELPLPSLSVAQLGALLGAFVLTCALVRPFGLQGRDDPAERAGAEAASLALGEIPADPPGKGRAELSGGRDGEPALSSVRAKLVNGVAVLPAGAPDGLKAVVAAANRINGFPYSYGGGHGSFESSGYDCSGAVSYALHGGGLLGTPLDSGGFTAWGMPGAGKAITVYANGGHAYAVIAGLRWDTSGTGGSGPSWHADMRSPAGFVARHPSNY